MKAGIPGKDAIAEVNFVLVRRQLKLSDQGQSGKIRRRKND